MRIAIALLMTLHGLAHLVGFVAPWKLASDRLTYKTTVLAGHLNVGDIGIRAFGLLWLLGALGFVLASAGAVTNGLWWPGFALTDSVYSLLLSILDWPDARIGVAVNAALVVLIVLGQRLAWW
jgi:hypothetical protein